MTNEEETLCEHATPLHLTALAWDFDHMIVCRDCTDKPFVV